MKNLASEMKSLARKSLEEVQNKKLKEEIEKYKRDRERAEPIAADIINALPFQIELAAKKGLFELQVQLYPSQWKFSDVDDAVIQIVTSWAINNGFHAEVREQGTKQKNLTSLYSKDSFWISW